MPASLIRLFLIALLLPLFGGCASRGIPQTESTGEQAAARALLQKSAEAHGLAAFRQINDLNVGYAGEWYGLASRVQATLVDPEFRQGSQERMLLKEPVTISQQPGCACRCSIGCRWLPPFPDWAFLLSRWQFKSGNGGQRRRRRPFLLHVGCGASSWTRAFCRRSLPVVHRQRKPPSAPRSLHDGGIGLNPGRHC